MADIGVGTRVRLRHGRATLTGEVVSVDGHKALVRVEREGEEPLELTRNLSFLDPAGAPASTAPSTVPHRRS